MITLRKILFLCMVSVFNIISGDSATHAKISPQKISGYVKSSFVYTKSDEKDPNEIKLTNARASIKGKVSDRTEYSVYFDTVRDNALLDAYIIHKIAPFLTMEINPNIDTQSVFQAISEKNTLTG